MNKDHAPRLATATGLLAAIVLALAGCGASSGAEASGSTSSTAGSNGSASSASASPTATTATTGGAALEITPAPDPESAAYPVTIASALGSITLDARPQRVVTWGWSTQDAVLALGLVPTAMPTYTYGGDAEGVLPWAAAALTTLGEPTPTLLTGAESGEVPFEQIAAAAPDLILAPYSGLTQQDYDTLSAIAPVVAYPDQPWATSWQDQTEIVGQALGLPAKARGLVEQTDADVAARAAANPVLSGKTFFYAAANQADQLNVYRESDPRVQLVEQLGMTVAPSVAALDPDPSASNYFYQLSYERLDQIDADVLVMYFGTQADLDTFLADPRIAALPQVAEGRFAPIVGESLVMASSAPTVLSIPWMLDAYVPTLAEAAATVG